MASRKKRDRKTTPRATSIAQPSTPARSTYRPRPSRVATATRRLQVDLAGLDILTPSGQGRPNPTRGGVPVQLKSAATVDQGKAQQSPSRAAKRDQRQVDMREPLGVKCRPDGRNRRAAGSGGARDFVPWNGKDC